MGWNGAKTAVEGREGWVKNVMALCASWHEEMR